MRQSFKSDYGVILDQAKTPAKQHLDFQGVASLQKQYGFMCTAEDYEALVLRIKKQRVSNSLSACISKPEFTQFLSPHRLPNKKHVQIFDSQKTYQDFLQQQSSYDYHLKQQTFSSQTQSMQNLRVGIQNSPILKNIQSGKFASPRTKVKPPEEVPQICVLNEGIFLEREAPKYPMIPHYVH